MIRLETSTPPSLNNAYVNTPRGRAIKPEAKAWKTALGWTFAASRQRPIRGPYAVTIEVDARVRSDIDNLIKLTLDALVLAGATDDDAKLQRVSIERAPITGAIITVEAVS